MAWDNPADWAALAANSNPDPYHWGEIAAAQAAATGITGVTANPAPDTTATTRDVFMGLHSMLAEAGLDGLYQVDANGMPDTNSWLWKYIVDHPEDKTLGGIGVALEGTDVFKARFPIIARIRDQNLKDPTHAIPVPSTLNVMDYEKTVREAMVHVGLPSSMTSNAYLQDLMAKGLSAPEIQTRLGQAYTRVADTDPAVLQAYQQFYGIGDAPGALAASFLDPEHMQGMLDKHSVAAYTAGIGKTMGINVGQGIAENIANQGSLTEGGIRQGLDRVSGLAGVFNEGITETKDLSTDTGLQDTFLGDAQAKADIERRVLERQANARAVVGGALSTNAGLTGVGSS